MKNISPIQVAVVGIIMMILRHYRIAIPENEIIAVLAGLMAIGGIMFEWYKGFSSGRLSLGGFKKE